MRGLAFFTYSSRCDDRLKEENRLLKERRGGQRLRFTDAERRRLARGAYALGRKELSELDTLVTRTR